MKPINIIIFILLSGLCIGYASGQFVSSASNTYTTEPGYTNENCQVMAISQLQNSTIEQNLNNQTIEINAAHSFEELGKLGAAC